MHHRFTSTTLKSLLSSFAAVALLLSTACSDDPENEAPVNTGKDGNKTTDTNNNNMSTMEPMLLGNGAPCTMDAECNSQKCGDYSLPDPRDPAKTLTGKACVDCRNDQECAANNDGKNFCVPALPEVAADSTDQILVTLSCSDGALGRGCIDQADCADGNLCSQISSQDLGTVSVCSACNTDADCADKEKKTCLVKVDVKNKSAYKECNDPLENGSFCLLGPNADAQCKNLCVELDFSGYKVGMCGDCRVDADCMNGWTCEAPNPNHLYHLCVDPNTGTDGDGMTTEEGTATSESTTSETGIVGG